MSYTKTTWTAREGTGLNKFTKTNETTTEVELTNNPDTVTVAGEVFSVANMNNIEAGLSYLHGIVTGVDTWAVGTTYSVIGKVVYHEGNQYTCFNNTSNVGKNPSINPLYWYPIPTIQRLNEMFAAGEPASGGLNDIADRAGTNYRQNISYGTDGTYNYYRVALDGTTLTGDTTLEAILDPGGTNEYFNINMIAPDSLGTRTFIDAGEYINTPQSVSGNNDTIGVQTEDRFQGHKHEIDILNASVVGSLFIPTIAIQSGNTSNPSILTGALSIENPITDGTNGTPRTGTTTRPKELTCGASYIIVKIPA